MDYIVFFKKFLICFKILEFFVDFIDEISVIEYIRVGKLEFFEFILEGVREGS